MIFPGSVFPTFQLKQKGKILIRPFAKNLTITILIFCYFLVLIQHAFADELNKSAAIKFPDVTQADINSFLPTGICTRDINSWGHASHCNCNGFKESVYNHRVGLCRYLKIEIESIFLLGEITLGNNYNFRLKTDHQHEFSFQTTYDQIQMIKSASCKKWQVFGDLYHYEIDASDAEITTKVLLHDISCVE